MTRRLGSVAAGVALAIVLAGTASAAAPEQGVEEFDFAGVFAECEGFDVIGEGTIWHQWAIFATKSGVDRIVRQMALDYVMTRSDTGEVVGSGWARNTLHAPLDGLQTSTFTGVRAFETFVDGSRIVEIGQIEFDGDGAVVHMGGPHPFETTGVDRCEHVAP